MSLSRRLREALQRASGCRVREVPFRCRYAADAFYDEERRQLALQREALRKTSAEGERRIMRYPQRPSVSILAAFAALALTADIPRGPIR